MSTHCPVHNAPWIIQPAGISKTKFDEFGQPKAYGAFQKCPIRGCDQRPPRTNGAPQAAPTPQPHRTVASAPQSEADARLRAACAAWAAACDYYATSTTVAPGFVETMAASGYRFMMAAYRGQPQPQPSTDFDPHDPEFGQS